MVSPNAPVAESEVEKVEKWFKRTDSTIHERVDEIVSYLKEHGAGDVEDIVKQAVADELKGDSVVAILRDIVHSEITKFIAGAAAVSPAAPVTAPVVTAPVPSSSPFNVATTDSGSTS